MNPPVTLSLRQGNAVVAARLRSRGVDELTARLFAARGVRDIMDVRGKYRDLLPVHSMKNVQAMANYLADCAVTKRRVLIVSDYDCDGATACAILIMAFGGCGMNFDYLVPDRQIHGYGLTPGIVEEAAALTPRPEVIITVDNGISSHAGVERAKELGIEVLVTDHHLAPDVLPDAAIIVNPNQPGCEFQSKNIAGCGVAWYVARALVEELTARDMDPLFEPQELLSYVALGTVADVVKLDRNNRILVAEGLAMIRNSHCAPGVLALCVSAGKNPAHLSCTDIGFAIGPRINAAGRLAHMSTGIECLTTLDDDLAAELAKQLHETNEERKEIQREMVDEAMRQASVIVTRELSATGSDEFGRRSLVVFDESFHEGVVGIVSGRLKEERHRPTIVFTKAHNGTLKGSGRSIPGLHLKHVLDEINIRHPGVLLGFGGHAMAAGMSIAPDALETFRDALENVCRAHLTSQMMTKTLLHDGELSERHFDIETIRALQMEVWGQGFEPPVFVNQLAVDSHKILGKDKSHLKLVARLGANDAGDGGVVTDVMLFGQSELAASLTTQLVVAFKPDINVFRGESRLQLMVECVPESMNPALAARRAVESAAAMPDGSPLDAKESSDACGPSTELASTVGAQAASAMPTSQAPDAANRRDANVLPHEKTEYALASMLAPTQPTTRPRISLRR